ncbi:MAG: peptide chain release factor 1, partial [Clostridiales bacterium]|nr:peptide chain release factor 1 [Clostridiales bacterium]
MFDKLGEVEKRYETISERLYDPDVVSNQEEYTALMKEHKSLTHVVEKYREYKAAKTAADEARAMLADGGLEKDFRQMVEEELDSSRELMQQCSEELKVLLLPRDPNDDKNVIVEIRGGAGGEEAALFSAALYRMYTMYAESKGFKSEILSANETELGGFKEVSFMISGDGAYSRLKFESGVHRVQRVPETETQGRIHTSTVTVAVLPEAEEVELEINPSELQIDTFRASGAGGQHVNKTESAIRIIHIPSGITVECQDERSQFKNKERALKLIRAKLLEGKRQEQEQAIAAER